MQDNSHHQSVQMNIDNQLCKVCGELAAGFHFGAFTCEGCKSFFGRTYNNTSSIGECKNNDQCVINKKNRTSCKSCRLKKCFQVGMAKEHSRYGRRSNWFKVSMAVEQKLELARGVTQTNGSAYGLPTNGQTPTGQPGVTPANLASALLAGKGMLPQPGQHHQHHQIMLNHHNHHNNHNHNHFSQAHLHHPLATTQHLLDTREQLERDNLIQNQLNQLNHLNHLSLDHHNHHNHHQNHQNHHQNQHQHQHNNVNVDGDVDVDVDDNNDDASSSDSGMSGAPGASNGLAGIAGMGGPDLPHQQIAALQQAAQQAQLMAASGALANGQVNNPANNIAALQQMYQTLYAAQAAGQQAGFPGQQDGVGGGGVGGSSGANGGLQQQQHLMQLLSLYLSLYVSMYNAQGSTDK